jgi:glycosyltransferase involved in cell wall biosynthesis
VHYTTAQERRLAERGMRLGRGAVIPLGVPETLLARRYSAPGSRPRHPALPSAPYVLILGRLHPKKGIEPFAEAFLDVTRHPAVHHWRLVVAGDGERRHVARLRALLRERCGAERVVFTGWLDDAAREAALRDAALLALPSQQENFGLSVAEAMACGVPVLVSPAVNLADDIDAARAGWVSPVDRGALRRTLLAALQNGAERAARGAAGQALARSRFTWPAVAAQLRTLYRAVSQGTAPSPFEAGLVLPAGAARCAPAPAVATARG